MDKRDSKELTVVKATIFDKIKDFLKKLFSKKEKTKAEIIEEVQQEIKENDFINRIKIEEDKEEARLNKLQNLIAEDVISEDELPEEDVKALHNLYDSQILELKKQIDGYREKILKLRMNINE